MVQAPGTGPERKVIRSDPSAPNQSQSAGRFQANMTVLCPRHSPVGLEVEDPVHFCQQRCMSSLVVLVAVALTPPERLYSRIRKGGDVVLKLGKHRAEDVLPEATLRLLEATCMPNRISFNVLHVPGAVAFPPSSLHPCASVGCARCEPIGLRSCQVKGPAAPSHKRAAFLPVTHGPT